MESTDKLLEESSAITPSEIIAMKVPDLKRELKLRGLPITGNKPELLERLQTAIAKGFESLESADEVNEDEVLGDVNLLSGDDSKVQELIEDDILEAGNTKDLEESLDLLATKTSPLTAMKAKTTIIRSPVILANKPSLALAEKKDLDSVVDASKENCSNVAKYRKLTSEERLAIRAKKFNQPLSAESKLKIRNERFGLSTKIPTTAKQKLPITNDAKDLDKLKQRAQRFGQILASDLKQVEDKEKLMKRTKRFGMLTSSTSVSNAAGDDDTKKLQRSKRFGLP